MEDIRTQTDARRSDRWTAGPSGRRNGWTVVAALLVLGAYAAAVVAAASVRGSIGLTDEAQIALVGAAPSLGVAAAVLAWVGTRRPTLRAFSWLVLALAVLLVATAAVLLAMILLALADV